MCNPFLNVRVQHIANKKNEKLSFEKIARATLEGKLQHARLLPTWPFVGVEENVGVTRGLCCSRKVHVSTVWPDHVTRQGTTHESSKLGHV